MLSEYGYKRAVAIDGRGVKLEDWWIAELQYRGGKHFEPNREKKASKRDIWGSNKVHRQNNALKVYLPLFRQLTFASHSQRVILASEITGSTQLRRDKGNKAC
jgi:hypothetical protein